MQESPHDDYCESDLSDSDSDSELGSNYEYEDAYGRPYLDTLIPQKSLLYYMQANNNVNNYSLPYKSKEQLEMFTNLRTGEECPLRILEQTDSWSNAMLVYEKEKDHSENDNSFEEYQKKKDDEMEKIKHDNFMASLPKFSTAMLKKMEEAKLKTKEPSASDKFYTWRKGATASSTSRQAWGHRRNGGGKFKAQSLTEMNSEKAAAERTAARKIRQKANKEKALKEMEEMKQKEQQILKYMTEVKKSNQVKEDVCEVVEETDYQKFKREEIENAKRIQVKKMKDDSSDIYSTVKLRNEDIIQKHKSSPEKTNTRVDKWTTVCNSSKKTKIAEDIVKNIYALSSGSKKMSKGKPRHDTNRHKSNSGVKQCMPMTILCKSVTKNTKCIHGTRCNFAHSVSQLSPRECHFGNGCRNVKKQNGKWVNTGTYAKCMFSHPGEEKVHLCSRLGMKV